MALPSPTTARSSSPTTDRRREPSRVALTAAASTASSARAAATASTMRTATTERCCSPQPAASRQPSCPRSPGGATPSPGATRDRNRWASPSTAGTRPASRCGTTPSRVAERDDGRDGGRADAERAGRADLPDEREREGRRGAHGCGVPVAGQPHPQALTDRDGQAEGGDRTGPGQAGGGDHAGRGADGGHGHQQGQPGEHAAGRRPGTARRPHRWPRPLPPERPGRRRRTDRRRTRQGAAPTRAPPAPPPSPPGSPTSSWSTSRGGGTSKPGSSWSSGGTASAGTGTTGSPPLRADPASGVTGSPSRGADPASGAPLTGSHSVRSRPCRERAHEAVVELRAGAASSSHERLLDRARLAVGAGRRHRVEGVGDRDDPGELGDLRRRPDPSGSRGRRSARGGAGCPRTPRRGTRSRAPSRARARGAGGSRRTPRGEAPGLLQHPGRDAELADVVQHAGEVQRSTVLAQAGRPRDEHRARATRSL